MDIKQAIEILETHNRWRRGDDTVPMLKPKDIGIAIDVVVEHVKNNVVLEDVIVCDNFKCDNKAEYFYCNDCENERNDI